MVLVLVLPKHLHSQGYWYAPEPHKKTLRSFKDATSFATKNNLPMPPSKDEWKEFERKHVEKNTAATEQNRKDQARSHIYKFGGLKIVSYDAHRQFFVGPMRTGDRWQ